MFVAAFVKHFKAIAAMSLNRVIGQGNKIPWHLPEDFKWFKQTTSGHVVLMGRKTFESLGRPLLKRVNLVVTRDPARLRALFPEALAGARLVDDSGVVRLPEPQSEAAAATQVYLLTRLDQVDPRQLSPDVFVCGGVQLYEQLLPRCSDLFLTVVKRQVEGDAFFPAFEDRFELHQQVLDRPEFTIFHYRPRSLAMPGSR
jgi:dihydrofolate reductase